MSKPDDPAPRALLIDLGGVIYQGDELIDGAAATAGWLRDQGIPHRFLTNTTSRPRSALVDKLRHLGIDADADDILTPAVAANAWLREHGIRRVALYVAPALEDEFAGFERLDDERVEAVIVGDMGDAWDFATLNRAFQLLMSETGPALLALGMSRYFLADDGLRLDTAPFVVALSHASGAEPVVLGKPAGPFFRAALETLHASAGATVMIGDDLHADVGGAQAAGLIGVLVRTGKYRGVDADDAVRPDAVLDSIAQLPDWWRRL